MIARMPVAMSGAETSVRGFRDVLRDLARLREILHVRTADETIRVLTRNGGLGRCVD